MHIIIIIMCVSQTVEEKYLQEKRALPGSDLPVDFETEEIELDIPEEGLTLDEGWIITPLIPPVVSYSYYPCMHGVAILH